MEGAPINYCYKGYKFGNKFLAGDAAGFASGLTGEGIYFAMASGDDVAKMIIDKNYKPLLIKKILRKKRKHEFILGFLKKRFLAEIGMNSFVFLLRFEYFKNQTIKFIA